MQYNKILFLLFIFTFFGCITNKEQKIDEVVLPLKIEGENYSSMSNVQIEAHVGYFDAGDWIAFHNVDFGKGTSGLIMNVASDVSGGVMELRLDGHKGELLGSFEMTGTGGWYKFEERSIGFNKAVKGKRNLYFIGVKGHGIFNLDWFKLLKTTLGGPLYADKSRGEWTLIVIPDTQHYSENRSNAPIDHMRRAFDWIASMRDQLNIKMVQGLGDITQNWSNTWEWDNAASAWNKLEGKMAYMPTMGNHDDPATMNRYFPVSRFANKPWWGSDYGGIENNYLLMRIGSEDYLFLHVECYDEYSKYRPAGINWAKDVLNRYPHKKVILATHDNWNTRHIRDQLLSKYNNIVLSNAGHTCVREEYYRSNGPNGNTTHNFITDYQCDSQEIMLLRYYIFKPLEDKVDYYTYSPITKQFENDWNSQGSIPLVQKD